MGFFACWARIDEPLTHDAGVTVTAGLAESMRF